jgi:hypothetical protein
MDALIVFFESITLLGITRWLMTIFLVVYTIFAYLMMRQVKIMIKAVSMKDDYIIKIFSIGHFAFAMIVLIMTILIL